MIIIDYQKKHHKKIIHACVEALKAGKVIAYTTDTSYGLAADAMNIKGIKKLYQIKERDFNKPVHVVVPDLIFAKKVVEWNLLASKLTNKFWPGALTLVLPLKRDAGSTLKRLSAKTKFLGLRLPDNQIAIDLAKFLKRPVTATSANPSAHLSGGYDSYSAADVVSQFEKKIFQPDIVINAGKLKKRKPSTLVKITNHSIEILRHGPISEKQIKQVLKNK